MDVAGSNPVVRPSVSPLVAALILAGGQARRMGGGDKPLRVLAGRTLLDHILGRLRPAHALVALSANGNPSRFAAWGLPVLPDREGEGPLAGVLAGLRWAAGAGAETLLAVPGDAPLLPPDLAARLAPAPAYAVAGGRAHPLPMLLPTALAPALAAWIAAGQPRRVLAFLEATGARPVEFGAEEPFLNVNTPADLTVAERALAAHHTP